MSKTPRSEPPEPSPRQLLVAAELLAQDEPASRAALLAGMRPQQLDELLGEEWFRTVRADCATIEALPDGEQDRRLQRMLRRAVERALQDDRPGGIPGAFRLLDMEAARAVPARGAVEPKAASEEEAEPETPNGERWGLWPDGAGGWRAPDGGPAMPGRELAIVEAEGGPVRVLDADPEEVEPELLELLDGLDEDDTAGFNHAAYPTGGPQWDPVTRTFWCWQAPGQEQPPEGAPSAERQEPAIPDPRPAPAEATARSAGRRAKAARPASTKGRGPP